MGYHIERYVMADHGDEENLNNGNEFVADDALPICPECFEPCDPLQNYCDKCGSNDPINPLASYMPFVDIRFKIGMFGKIWRKVVDGGNTPLWMKFFFVLVLLMAAPLILIVGPGVFLISKIKTARPRNTVMILFFVFLIMLFITYFLLI